MSEKERRYLRWLSAVESGTATLAAAAEGMRVSYRQARRLLKKYREEGGDAGLVHGHRGKPSTRQIPEETRSAVLLRYRERYSDFGPTLAAEHLSTSDNLPVNHETLRLWLIAEGLWQKREAKKAHRTWRQRKAQFGEMLQIDGSIHDWFEGRGKRCFLMSAVDDATGRCHLRFAEQETTWAAIDLLEGWISRYGCPQSVYVDRKSVYISDREQTPDEELLGKPALTQFGNVCYKLDIRVIAAHSPQAKGRVERKHGVCQDRLIKEMRLAGVSSIEAANAFLETWTSKLNDKFEKLPREEADAHRSFPESLTRHRVFCLEETRTVSKDWTVRCDNAWYQVLKDKNLPVAGEKVTVQTARDGQVTIVGKRGLLLIRKLEKAPEKPKPINTAQPAQNREPRKPAQDHPWRTYEIKPGVTAPGSPILRTHARPSEITAMVDQYLPVPNYASP